MTVNSHPVLSVKAGPALVVHGLDSNGKPRAAQFKSPQASVALKAAALMNLTTFKITTAEQAALAAKLPAGRLYSNGKGFVPFVRRDLYASLLDAAAGRKRREKVKSSTADRDRVAIRAAGRKDPVVRSGTAADPAPPMSHGLPRTWSEIEVGHLVIAHISIEDGWWEAIVTEREDDVLTLRFRDYPKVEPFKRPLSDIGLINPLI